MATKTAEILFSEEKKKGNDFPCPEMNILIHAVINEDFIIMEIDNLPALPILVGEVNAV
jgi:hypothetical protein